jgi:23S rRNA U2552 (ribose-2'-O)-methylase RlmE/FtsJ
MEVKANGTKIRGRIVSVNKQNSKNNTFKNFIDINVTNKDVLDSFKAAQIEKIENMIVNDEIDAAEGVKLIHKVEALRTLPIRVT